MVLRQSFVLLPMVALAACAPTQPGEGERTRVADQRFTSDESVLLDFELDGRLLADTADDAKVRTQIEMQLMYSVGQLNVDRSVGRHERLELSNIQTTFDTATGRHRVTYHAKLPVAWGVETTPSVYALTLPIGVTEADQTAFAAKYGRDCVDPAAGVVDAGRMFLFFRPRNTNCAIAGDDVVTPLVTVTKSIENTEGKYPEYHHIWDDGALNILAMFSRALPPGAADDEGVRAYDEFVTRANDYLKTLQPDAAKRTAPAGLTATPGDAMPRVELTAALPDGRRIGIHISIVGYRLLDDGAAFDTWYDARTPYADMILYNGHAGLGDNVRALTKKGKFVAKKYVIWMLNGCDTFAYVDNTLADRRAQLNPDDPSGTKYMDTVSNVLSGYFATTPAGSMSFVTAIAEGRDPAHAKKYREIFSTIDATQGVVVTGEDDNVFDPKTVPIATPQGAAPGLSDGGTSPAEAPADPDEEGTAPRRPAAAPAPEPSADSGCSVGGAPGHDGSLATILPLIALAALAARRRRSA